MDRFHVRDISQGTNAKSKDWKVVVHHFERNNMQVTDLERMMFHDSVQLDGRHPRIAILCKAVRQHL